MNSPETRQQAESLLRNWGRWCRDDWWKHLGYKAPPTSIGYIAPRNRQAPNTNPPVDVDDAWRANEAVIRIGNGGGFEDYRILVAWYAHNHSITRLEDMFKCSRATVYRRRSAAIDNFWRVYHDLRACDVRQKHA